MTNPKWEERILAVPRKRLFEDEGFTFQGTVTGWHVIQRVMQNIDSNWKVVRRGGGHKDSEPAENNAEINYDMKQPIPYVLIRKGKEIFAYKRLSGGGEARLHDKISIGFGGHMNEEPEAVGFAEILEANMWRELNEELHIGSHTIPGVHVIGLINDDVNDVGRVHIGLLAILDLPEDASVAVKETDQLEGFWTTVEELSEPETFLRLESWSQIAVTALKAK